MVEGESKWHESGKVRMAFQYDIGLDAWRIHAVVPCVGPSDQIGDEIVRPRAMDMFHSLAVDVGLYLERRKHAARDEKP